MKFSVLKKEDKLTEVDLNNSLDKESYYNLIFWSKVIVACIYAFGLGFSLYKFGDDFIKVGIYFLGLLIITYILIDYPYTFLKALILPNTFDKDTITLKVNLYTMAIDVVSKNEIPKKRIILSLVLPFIILAVIPTIISYIIGFNIYFYVIASASAIIGIKDIIFLIFILKNHPNYNLIKLEINSYEFSN